MSNSGLIAKNTLFLYLRSFLVLVISLYTSRVILRVLGVVDYGIFNVVGGVIGMMAFLSQTMQATYQRFFNVAMGKGDHEKVKLLFRTSLSSQLIMALIVIALAETVGLWFVVNKLTIPAERMMAARWVYQVAVLSFIITMMSAPFGALITAYERMRVFALISVVDAVLRLIIVFLLMIIPYDSLIVYAVMLLMISILNLFLYALYCKRKIDTTDFRFYWEKRDLLPMFTFGGWSLMESLAQTMKSHGLNILLNLFFGPVVNAARGIAYQVLTAVNLFIQSFQTSFRPQLTKSYASGNNDYMARLYYSATKISYYLIFTLSLPILLETPYLLHLWLGDTVPQHTVLFTRLVLATAFVSAFANPTSAIAYATGKIKWFSIIVSGVNLMILPVAYLFLKKGYGPASAFVVSLVLTVLVQATRLLVTSRLTTLDITDYLRHVLLPTTVYSLLTPWLAFAMTQIMPQGFARLLLTSFLSVSTSLLFVWLVGLDKEEKRWATNKLKPLRSKFHQ